jgi:hypothetical protein
MRRWPVETEKEGKMTDENIQKWAEQQIGKICSENPELANSELGMPQFGTLGCAMVGMVLASSTNGKVDIEKRVNEMADCIISWVGHFQGKIDFIKTAQRQ